MSIKCVECGFKGTNYPTDSKFWDIIFDKDSEMAKLGFFGVCKNCRRKEVFQVYEGKYKNLEVLVK